MDTAEKHAGLRAAFLERVGWSGVQEEALPADASFRRYYRVRGGAHSALLMQDPPDRPPVPPYVMVEPFVAIAAHLRRLGLHAPEVYAQDIENGLLLLEDFGDATYTRLFAAGEDPRPLYEMAIDVLIHLHRHPDRAAIDVPAYDQETFLAEAMLLMDWYYPALTGRQADEALKKGYATVWRELLALLPDDAAQQTLVLRDYHVDNLILTETGVGIGRCGVLDFQDALIGPSAYDVMSLIEDARRDLPADLRAHLYARYLDGMGDALDRASFAASFRILAAQRHAKVLGIFMRLKQRDGKDRYLKFIPHVQRLLMAALADPVLSPLARWFAENGVDIGRLPPLGENT